MKKPILHVTGSGQPFVWLHGMLNSVESDSLYSLVDFEQLAQLVSVIRYNYCDKSSTGNYTWECLAEELFQIIDTQKIGQAILGGLSMGSGILLHAAVKHPERVMALLLVTPPPAWEKRSEVKKVYTKIASKTNPNRIPELLRRIVTWNQEPPEYYEQKHPGTRQKIQNFRLSFEPGYYTRLYQDGAASDMPSHQQIAKISVPTLIVAQTNDENHPLETANELHAMIKGSELVTVSNYQDFQNLQKKVHEFISKVLQDNKS